MRRLKHCLGTQQVYITAVICSVFCMAIAPSVHQHWLICVSLTSLLHVVTRNWEKVGTEVVVRDVSKKIDCRVCFIFCSMWSIDTHSAMELNNRVACLATVCWTATLWSGVSFIISGSNLQFFHRFLLMGLVELCYYWTCVFLCWWWEKELVLGPTPRGKRKVIVATNIAETSVTLEVGALTCDSLSLFHVCWVFVW